MKSLHKHSLIALAVLCVALWGCASTDDDAVATNESTVTTVNPDGSYPTNISAEATPAASAESLAANAAVKEPIVDTTPAMTVRTTNSTLVSGTSGTSSAVAVDNTATLSTGTTGVSGSLTTTEPVLDTTTTLDTTPATVTAVTTPVPTPVSEPMTSSSTLNDQEDTTATTTTTTRTRLRKD